MSLEDIADVGLKPEEHFATPPKAPRKKRSPNKKKEQPKLVIDVDALGKIIGSMHLAVSIMLRDPRWMLLEEESVMLATSLQHVTDSYDISIDPRWAAALELIGVCGMIYVPRMMAGTEPPETSHAEVH